MKFRHPPAQKKFKRDELKKREKHDNAEKEQQHLGTTSRNRPPGQGPRLTGGDDEIDRLVAMLQRIQKMLKDLINLKLSKMPSELSSQFTASWPDADRSFTDAIATLNNPTHRLQVKPQLAAAGFTDFMLGMKETSLKYHFDRADKAILTYSPEKSILEKFVERIKPAFKVMNSILGSLLRAFPGLDIAKELKEHLEAAYEVVETADEDSEL